MFTPPIKYDKRPVNESSCILDPEQQDGVLIYANLKNSNSFQKAKKEGLKPRGFPTGQKGYDDFSKGDQCIFFNTIELIKSSTLIGIRVNLKKTRIFNKLIRWAIEAGNKERNFLQTQPSPYAYVNASSISLEDYLKLEPMYSKLPTPKDPYSVNHSGQLVWLTEAEAKVQYVSEWVPEIVIETSNISSDKFAYESGDVH